MPRRNAPEFYYIEKRNLYRKRVKGPDGRWHDAYGRTKAACRENATRMLEELREAPAPLSDELLVVQYAKKWFDLNAPSMKAATRARYATNINAHILPAIGNMPLADVRHDDIIAMMNGCSGLSKATKAKILTAARKIFAAAVKNDLIKANPVSDVKAEGPKAKRREALTKEQQAQLLAAVKGTRAETFCMLCLYAGLRREEALGLCWDAVDLDGEIPYLSVRRAVNFDPKTGKATLLEELKSDAASRDIPIPPELKDQLSRIRGGKTTGPVIRDDHGRILSKQSFRKLWDAVKVREEHEAVVWENGKKTRRMLRTGEKIPKHNVTIALDFHPTPHMLRHTYITRLILAGGNIKTVQYLAGHANVQITLDIYTHLMEDRPKDTSAAVLKAFGGT